MVKHSDEIDTRIHIPLDHYRTRQPPLSRQTGGKKPKAYRPGLPVMTVCTVARNAEKTLQRAIRSVTAQTYPNIEYVVIDGASTDGTLDIIRQNDDLITFWMSEEDEGSEDGISKALSFATGDFVVFCMADDQLEPDTAEIAVDAMTRNACDFVYGDIIRDDREGNYLFTWSSEPDFAAKIMTYFPISSPSFAVSRKFVDTVGGFFPNRNNSDYQWFIRAHVAGLKGVYDERFKVHFSEGGYSNFVCIDIALSAARTAVAFGGKPGPAWRHAIHFILIQYIRLALKAVLRDRGFEKIRPLIRKARGIS